ncbi:MAG TPA: S41 family peptidase [Sphingobacteriaceae bacterium]
MISYKNRSVKLIIYISVLALSVVGCKKDPKITPDPVNPPSNASGTRAELTKDSIFLYAKEAYLWNDALPSYEQFNPRSYTQSSNELDNFNRELFAITQFKINPTTGKPYEYVSASATYPKYSYITDHEPKSPAKSGEKISEVTLEGVGTDFGFALTGVGNQTVYQIYIRYVNPGSPAAKAGLKRGDVLTQINGRTLGGNYTSDANFINSAFDLQSITVVVNGNGTTRTLTKVTYTSNPIFRDTIITSGTKKIGYLAFARFSSSSNAESVLTQTFSKFASGGVTDLVIDLRYNGGGYVSTAEHLLNLIAPSRLNGAVMFTEHYNSLLQSGKATILKNQPLTDNNDRQRFSNGRPLTYFDVDFSISGNTNKFSKKGSLDGVSKVVFIVTGNSASASELVINSLKPHLDVKIVGQKSYGKPVGFFPIKIDKYDVYYSMFQSKNSLGAGDYFDGFSPDASAADDVTRNFGEPQEASFASAIKYLTQGAFVASTSSVKIMGKTMSTSSVSFMDVGKDESFKGMIETRVKVRDR